MMTSSLVLYRGVVGSPSIEGTDALRPDTRSCWLDSGHEGRRKYPQGDFYFDERAAALF